jgi:hypothetical protein
MSGLRELKLVCRLLNPRVKPTYTIDFREAVAVIAAPFNRYLQGNPPDLTNLDIANCAELFVKHFNVPFIGQFEQTEILKQRGLSQPIIQSPSSDGEWVQTQVIMKWAAEQVFKMNRGKTVIVIGQRHHVRRIAILARYYGLDPRIPGHCLQIRFDPSNRPGDEWWCKSKDAYLFWEFCVARPGMIAKAALGQLR